MRNKTMLITYADSMGGSLPALNRALDRHFAGAVGGVHLLPFFPSSGDRGFAPLNYTEVDPAFGTWDDIAHLGQNRRLMFDFMINHLSRRSPQFLDFLEKHDGSEWQDLFLRYRNFWPGGSPTPQQVEQLYKRKPHSPCVRVQFADGQEEDIWCTFGEEQMDLDVSSPTALRFIRDNLNALADRGAAVIRLDAFAFAVKKLGTSCFFVEPEMWQLLEECRGIAAARGVELLLELHDHYTVQQKLASKGFMVYDFALPLLMLHSLYTGSAEALGGWLRICPQNCHTTLDTHDGMGVPDAEGLLNEAEMEAVIQRLVANGANIKWAYKEGAQPGRLKDAYQMNATYYSALEEDDDAYILARAIQFFCPGTPQVYYVGLLAGRNDAARFAATGLLTDINRHGYTEAEIDEAAKAPVVQRLIRLMEFRNSFDAFDGSFTLVRAEGPQLEIRREHGPHAAVLRANLAARQYTIHCSGPNGEQSFTF